MSRGQREEHVRNVVANLTCADTVLSIRIENTKLRTAEGPGSSQLLKEDQAISG